MNMKQLPRTFENSIRPLLQFFVHAVLLAFPVFSKITSWTRCVPCLRADGGVLDAEGLQPGMLWAFAYHTGPGLGLASLPVMLSFRYRRHSCLGSTQGHRFVE